MVVQIPRPLCIVLASVKLDVAEVRRQITAGASGAVTQDERESLVETAAQLLALESSIETVLGAQYELESSPEGTKP